MAFLKKYNVTLKHDGGQTIITFVGKNEKHVKQRICEVANCPPNAVIKVEFIENL